MTSELARIEAVVLVAIGGFAGASLRYAVELAVPSTLLATATVNVAGCVAIGLVLYEAEYTDRLAESTRTVLVTGFLASFTTYSTFVLDAVETAPEIAVGYVAGSYTLGFLGVVLGRAGARWLRASIAPREEVAD